MDESQGEDATLMAICADAPGCFEIDPKLGRTDGNWVYSKLIQFGYSSQSFASAGEIDGQSINYLHRLVYPETPQNEAVDKMRPECLKLAIVIRKCKLKQSASAAKNVVNKEE